MATTTNYGWDTPDDTDLVKDGASAIRTLGSSIDTTVKNLNPETTLGDISYRSSTANTNTRLAIGTTGQVLTVNSGVPAWTTLSSGGWTLLSTTTLSGATTTISGISGSYTNLRIEISGASNSGAVAGALRAAPNGTTNITTQSVVLEGSAVQTVSSYLYPNGWGNYSLTDLDNIHIVTIYNYSSTTIHKAYSMFAGWVNNNSVNSASSGGGWIKTTSAITSLDFTWTAGNSDAGTVKLYGGN